MWWFVASDICFDCLQHVLSLSRYAGPISRARVVSSPFSGLSRVHRTSKSRLAQGGSVAGRKKYNGLELDERTGGSRITSEMIRLRGTVKAQGSARKPPSGRIFF